MGKKHNNNQTKAINQQLKQKNAHIDEQGTFIYNEMLTIADFAKALNISVVEIIKFFMKQGKLFNQNQLLTEEAMEEACIELGFDFRKTASASYENIVETIDFNDTKSDMVLRAPVVTIMGHVDHGKTTLLDTIRNSKVTHKEHGGITQHIGAYQINTANNHLITFIDTPGHEAFTEMRARGSKITDIVVLVVAADDGVMPQTKEAIDHARAANVELIVFINKMDKPNINIERIKNELATVGLISEEWGGNTLFVYGSARQGSGIDELLSAILLVAEIKELTANPKRHANGTVIESNFDKNIGPVATLLVQGGTLKIKDIIVAGSIKGKIKKMINDLGKDVNLAIPSAVVQVLGFESPPKPGERFLVISDEKIARKISMARQAQDNFNTLQKQAITLGNIAQEATTGKLKQVNIILRADTQGSVQAITQALVKINVPNVQIKLIRATVGGISQSDVKLALASNSIIYGFNVRPNFIVKDEAKNVGVELRLHNVIYKITEEIEKAAKGLIEPEYKEKVSGQAKVMRTFHFSKVGTIAGCLVIEGQINRNSKIHLLRDDVVIFTGDIASLKHEKNDLKLAKKGTECGITIKNFNDIKENDVIEAFTMEIIT